MLLEDIKEFMNVFETITYCNVVDNVIQVRDNICSDVIPFGNLNKEYGIDKKYKEVNIHDYIIPLQYYCYFIPLSYDLMKSMFKLNDKVIQMLKNNKVDIYQIDIIMGGLLKDYGGYLDITSEQCFKLNRTGTYKVDIETPENLFEDDVVILTNSYYPNCLFVLD